MAITLQTLQSWLAAKGIQSSEVAGTAPHLQTLEIVQEEVWVDFDPAMQILEVYAYDSLCCERHENLISIGQTGFMQVVVRALAHHVG
jgi:hypothetical protein